MIFQRIQQILQGWALHVSLKLLGWCVRKPRFIRLLVAKCLEKCWKFPSGRPLPFILAVHMGVLKLSPFSSVGRIGKDMDSGYTMEFFSIMNHLVEEKSSYPRKLSKPQFVSRKDSKTN